MPTVKRWLLFQAYEIKSTEKKPLGSRQEVVKTARLRRFFVEEGNGGRYGITEHVDSSRTELSNPAGPIKLARVEVYEASQQDFPVLALDGVGTLEIKPLEAKLVFELPCLFFAHDNDEDLGGIGISLTFAVGRKDQFPFAQKYDVGVTVKPILTGSNTRAVTKTLNDWESVDGQPLRPFERNWVSHRNCLAGSAGPDWAARLGFDLRPDPRSVPNGDGEPLFYFRPYGEHIDSNPSRPELSFRKTKVDAGDGYSPRDACLVTFWTWHGDGPAGTSENCWQSQAIETLVPLVAPGVDNPGAVELSRQDLEWSTRWVLSLDGRHDGRGSGEWVFALWNDNVAHAALESANRDLGGAEVSFLSGIASGYASGVRAEAGYALEHLPLASRPLKGFDIVFDDRSLRYARVLQDVEGVVLRFPRLLDKKGEPVELRARVLATDLPLGEPAYDAVADRIALSFEIEDVKPAASLDVRFGSLDLSLDADRGATMALTASGKFGRIDGNTVPGTLHEWHVEIPRIAPGEDSDQKDWLGIRAIAPGGTDRLPDERRAGTGARLRPGFRDVSSRPRYERTAARTDSGQALVINLSGDSAAQYYMRVRESWIERGSRELDLNLRYDASTKSPSLDLIVMDDSPFSVARIEVGSLLKDAEGVETDGELANWSLSELEGQKWEIGGIEDGFVMRLPPQAVGEAMEKGTDHGAITPGAPIDFRFGSPARLTLRSSYFRQRFSEAPWNLRRVMGYPGQRAPGAGVEELEFELFYGMKASVRGRDAGQRLRLAELGSRVGAVLPQRTDPVDGKSLASLVRGPLWTRWNRINRAYNRRLAVYELWSEAEFAAQGDVRRPHTGSLRLDKGVSFELRDRADLAYPILRGRRLNEDSVQEPDRKHLPTKRPHDRRDDRYIDGPPEMGGADTGLKGGISWGFESDAIYREVRAAPKSTEGLVERVFLSALGGWGYQRASFANGKTKIYTDTAMGRGTYYSVERIGRISVFWNRAKHVIVYERTVLPSEQFWPDQELHAGRPLMRKVREYVEIIEPVRRFPDKDDNKFRRGFVEALEFPHTIIPVDGRWGEDVINSGRAVGWEIPLWREKNANPSVYRKPKVRVGMAGDKDGIAEKSLALVRNPQALRFYTSTLAQDTDNTDLWAPVLDVDFANAPQPEPEEDAALNAADPDQDLPDVVLVPRGLERFSLEFESQTSPANVVAERADSPLGARIDAITMMRASPMTASKIGETGAAVEALEQMRRELGRTRDAMQRALENPEQALENARKEVDRFRSIKGSLREKAKTVSMKLGAFAGQIENIDASFCEPLKVAAKAHLDIGARRLRELANIARADVNAECDRLPEPDKVGRQVVQSVLTELRSTLEIFPKQIHAGTADLDEVCRQARRSLAQARSGWAAERSGLEARIDAAIAAAQNDVTAAKAGLLSATDEGSNAVRTTMSRIERVRIPPEVGAAARPIADLVDEACAFGDRLAECLRNTVYEKIQPINFPDTSALRAAAHSALGTLDVEVGKIVTACDVVVNDVANFGSEIDRLAAAANTAVEELLDGIESVPGRLFPDLRPTTTVILLKAEIAALFEEFERGVEALQGRVADLVIVGVGRLCTSAKSYFEPLATRLRDLEGLVDNSANELDKILDDIAAHGADKIEELKRRFSEIPLFRRAEALRDEVRRGLESLGKSPTFQDPAETLRLVRAVGEGPLLPEMKFNRKRMAYFFDDYANAVRTTPAAALVNRVKDDLEAMGLRVPMRSILDRVIPDRLQDFDLGKILPDFSGLKNSSFFRNVRLPEIANDQIVVQHGIDKETQSAWLKASVDVQMGGANEVFSFSGLTLSLISPRFKAQANLDVDLDGVRRTTDAEIFADWELRFGGANLVTFEKTRLYMDRSGGFHVDISPDRVRMDRALQWIGDAVKKMGYDESGFSLRFLQDKNGLPAGVRATLDLVAPPISTVAVNISGMALGAVLELGMLPRSGTGSVGREFAIELAFNVSRKSQPFSLRILILGGGGWIESRARYLPETGKISTHVSIGISASAGAMFAFGPVQGGVMLYLGVFVEYASGDGKPGGGLTIGVMLLVTGSAVVCGIVTVSISLMLQLTYNGRELIGYGRLSISVRVSRFFKISVSVAVTYSFSSGNSTTERSVEAVPEGRLKAAADLINRRRKLAA